MERKKMTLKDSLNLVRAKRSIAEPNPGFFVQLLKYERKLFGENSMLPTD
jgi:hypothetical protein